MNRAAAWLLMLGLLVPLPGCDERDPRLTLQVLPSRERVRLGPLESYAEPGIYTRHVDEHGVYVVTIHPGESKYLFALWATCPHNGEPVRLDSITGRLTCRPGDHRYTREGLPANRGYEGLGLPRVAVLEADGHLEIAPTRRYYFEKQEWSLPQSMLELPVALGG